MSFEDVRRIAIAGAGVSGPPAAKMLLAEGYEVTVFERREQLGGVWADGYLNFGVQVHKELHEFPDWPLPPDAPRSLKEIIQLYEARDYASIASGSWRAEEQGR